MHPDVAAALTAGRGLVVRRQHPGLKHAIDHALRTGELERVLCGIYAHAADAHDLAVRARAARLADPNAIVTGAAAAVLGGWKHIAAPEEITIASHGLRRPQPGFRFERRHIDPTLTRRMDGYVVTTRALTALDLAVAHGDAQLEDALRHGVELRQLKQALLLSPGRRGFAHLREVVHMMRDRPWSPLELAAHKLLRQAHVTGWDANRAIYDRRGEELLAYGDLVWATLHLIVELDGWDSHGRPDARSRDAARDLSLAREGWEVVRIESALVFRQPSAFVRAVQDIVRTRLARTQRRSP